MAERTDPKTDPCGSPDETKGSNEYPLCSTTLRLLDKYEMIVNNKFGGESRLDNFCSEI